MQTAAEYHCQRLGALRSDRSQWDSQWEEAAARVVPAHVNTFTGRSSVASQEGAKNTEQQFDSTTAMAAQRFAAVMESLVTPQNSIWHMMKPVDSTLRRNRAVRAFFDDLVDRLFNYRYRPVANFVGNSQQAYLSLGVYGNGILYIDQPEREPGLRYRNIHLGEAYFVENHAGVVDTMYRCYTPTLRQILERFREAPKDLRESASNPGELDKKKEVLHVVTPRSDFLPGGVGPRNMPFGSYYYLVETKASLEESGYDTFPFAVARYTQMPGETYGRGPAQWVLPAIKVLSEQKKTVLKQGHRIVDPVLLAHDDGNLGAFSMKAGALNPGGVSKEGRLLVQPLPVGNIAVGDKMMDMEKAIIQDAFLITLFQILVDSPQMTATEVLERAREKGMLLAPTAGRLQAEFLGVLIEREVSLLARQGLMPRVPQILLDAAVEYRIEYDSPMSRMQRAEKAAGFMRALDVAANYAKMTGDVEALDHFNFDAAMPEILDIQGAPIAWTRAPEDVEARRAQRAQAAQMQQMAEVAPAAAGVIKAVGDAGVPA